MAAETEVELDHPVTFGETEYSVVVLREPSAGDVMEAQEESERLVYTPEGPALVSSPARVGLNLLRRQIVRLGREREKSYDGPLGYEELKRFHVSDINRLQRAADELEGAADAEAVQQQAATRGRGEGVDRAD